MAPRPFLTDRLFPYELPTDVCGEPLFLRENKFTWTFATAPMTLGSS